MEERPVITASPRRQYSNKFRILKERRVQMRKPYGGDKYKIWPKLLTIEFYKWNFVVDFDVNCLSSAGEPPGEVD